jgi:ribosome-binding factor A
VPKGHGPALDTVGVPLCVRLGLLYRKDKDMAEKEPSQRQLRVGQEIKKILAGEIERGLVRNLEGIDAMVTIMEVRVSPDLKYANVYFITSVNEKNEEVREALQLAANHFRKIIGAKMELRYVPELNFRIDTSFAEVDKMERLLRDPRVAQDLKKS